tara:strand:+ start:237 stop:443 length:207 start_codon:yes stop_codon:yes gene_type:complete
MDLQKLTEQAEAEQETMHQEELVDLVERVVQEALNLVEQQQLQIVDLEAEAAQFRVVQEQQDQVVLLL